MGTGKSGTNRIREGRQKYKDRFFNNDPEPDPEPEPDKDPEQATPTTFEELFHFE